MQYLKNITTIILSKIYGGLIMKFQKYLIITGTDVRTKKDGSPYYLLHILMDNGQTCTLPYKGNVINFIKIHLSTSFYKLKEDTATSHIFL